MSVDDFKNFSWDEEIENELNKRYKDHATAMNKGKDFVEEDNWSDSDKDKVVNAKAVQDSLRFYINGIEPLGYRYQPE